MSSRVRIIIGHRSNSVEGHIKQCMLLFNGRPIWGSPNPISCHDNTSQIKTALERADSRFVLLIFDKPHSVEGHRATITITKGNNTYLENLHTHENMVGLQTAVNNALDAVNTALDAGEEKTAPDAGEEKTAPDTEEKNNAKE